MKVTLDEKGAVFADVNLAAVCAKAIAEQRDFHIGSIVALDVFRSQMLQLPKDSRPIVEWVLYGVHVKMNKDMRYHHNDPRLDIYMDALNVLIGGNDGTS